MFEQAPKVVFRPNQCPVCENHDASIQRCRGFTSGSSVRPLLGMFDGEDLALCSKFLPAGLPGRAALRKLVEEMMGEADRELPAGEKPFHCLWLFRKLWDHRDLCRDKSHLERLRGQAQAIAVRLLVDGDKIDRQCAAFWLGDFGDGQARKALHDRVSLKARLRSRHEKDPHVRADIQRAMHEIDTRHGRS